MSANVARPQSVAIGSLKVDTPNIGDHIQILACLDLMSEMGLEPSVFVDRDTELGREPQLGPSHERLLLPLNGWFKLSPAGDPQWPPHEKIVPVFSGFHVRPHVCPALLEQPSLDYFHAHEPIGCRDPFTMEMLRARGIATYFTNCLSLTFPTRPPSERGDAVIVASIDQGILGIIPPELRDGHIFINHYCQQASFEAYLEHARSLLDLYRRRARLVITTFLHCALPCLAMGIPVIVFYPNRTDDFMTRSDRERFSGLKTLVPIYAFPDAPAVNWAPPRIDIERQKEFTRQDFRAKIEKRLRGAG